MQESTSPQQDTSANSLSEKKRNKLGYHRTSVACVHCRRRKIRCLVDPNDQQGRCQNCIRLKKECNFFPVDQQPPNERQRRPATKPSSQPSSSPAPLNQGHGDGFTYASPPGGYPPPPPPPPPPSAGGIPNGPMAMTVDTANFNISMRNAAWDAAGYIESPVSAPAHMSEAGPTGYWPPYSAGPESARSAQFPGSFGSERQDSWAPPHQQHQSHMQQAHPAAGMGVVHPAQQQRSMSLQHDGQSAYGGLNMSGNAFYDGRAGPPSLNNSNGSPATTVSLSEGTAAPGQTQPVMHYGLPQQWDPSKEYLNGPQGHDMGATWYANQMPGMSDEAGQGWQPPPQGHSGFKPA